MVQVEVDRVAMIDRGGALPLIAQCDLFGVSRSSQYYEPLGENADTAAGGAADHEAETEAAAPTAGAAGGR